MITKFVAKVFFKLGTKWPEIISTIRTAGCLEKMMCNLNHCFFNFCSTYAFNACKSNITCIVSYIVMFMFKEEDEDKEKEEDDEECDDWMVPHGYLSDGEGIDDEEEVILSLTTISQTTKTRPN